MRRLLIRAIKLNNIHHMKTREEILESLESQYMKQYAMDGYPMKFEAQASLCQCNFGGLLMIVGNSGDSAIVWGDWADAAVDEELTECEIEYIEDEDNKKGELKAAIKYGETYFYLDNFLRHDR